MRNTLNGDAHCVIAQALYTRASVTFQESSALRRETDGGTQGRVIALKSE